MEGVIANANEAFLTRKQLAESMRDIQSLQPQRRAGLKIYNRGSTFSLVLEATENMHKVVQAKEV